MIPFFGLRPGLAIWPNRVYFVYLLLLFFSQPSKSSLLLDDSTQSTPSFSKSVRTDAAILLSDAGAFYSSPLHFTSIDWLYTGAAVGGTALCFALDESARRSLGRQGTISHSTIWELPTLYGDLGVAGTLSVGTYIIGGITNNEDVHGIGRMLGESITLVGVPVLLVKFVTGRSRPYLEEGAGTFRGFEFTRGRESFPSGHSAVAFAVSTVLAESIDNTWASIGLYGLAAWTAFSRMYTERHWLSDVAAGSGLGIAAGLFVVGKERERSSLSRSSDRGLFLLPSHNGLSLVYFF